MTLTNGDSLAQTTDNVLQADFFGDKIGKKDARAAIEFLNSRYLPAWPKNKKVPPEQQPHIFRLTDSDKASRLHSFMGEAVSGAAARMTHSREAARALLVLGKLTGTPVPNAEAHCREMRVTALVLPARGLALF